ncbi:MAG TPA: ribose 5-phosphate isomerase B [Acidimicrobiaceae bacterium]|nr:ribose 5-phosphate isomerase B [Acidimicrobiaceae bacterium]HAX04144.1 ribose 5-phosphate isomerase B [Acidimicrobiaceae bacterium]
MSVIALGADHAGFALKQVIVQHLVGGGHEVVDCGTNDESRVDYPDYGVAVGAAIVNGDAECGVVVCGSGIGIVMAAGKVSGIRAATVHDMTTARLSREHNDANVIGIGARMVGEQTALDIVDAYLDASFEGGRHQGRVEKLDAI